MIINRMSLVSAAPLAAALLLAACSPGLVVDERDGEGGIVSTGGVPIGYLNGRTHTEVGGMWTSGRTFCRTAEDVVARIVSIEPVEVAGEVEVVAIRVRSAYLIPAGQPFEEWDPVTQLFNAAGPGPPNGRPPAGYVVPSCGPGAPVGEILTTLRKTGPGGGWLEGLRVTYLWEGRLHRFVIPWTFALCGTETPICD